MEDPVPPENDLGVGKRKRKLLVKDDSDEVPAKLAKLSKTQHRKKPKTSKHGNGRESSRSVTIYVPVPPPEAKVHPSVVLSLLDKAKELSLSDDSLTCYGCKGGYRMVRATHGVHRGSYFWEALLRPSGDGTPFQCRIGWSTRQGELQAPVGYDQHGYAYRSLEGSRIHNSYRRDNYGESFGVGDVVGCFIHLNDDPRKNQIAFFKNGRPQGVAYSGTEIRPGVYYPALSLYSGGVARVNFGPTFIVGHDMTDAHPMSEFQPFSPADRLVHDQQIRALQQDYHAMHSSAEGAPDKLGNAKDNEET